MFKTTSEEDYTDGHGNCNNGGEFVTKQAARIIRNFMIETGREAGKPKLISSNINTYVGSNIKFSVRMSLYLALRARCAHVQHIFSYDKCSKNLKHLTHFNL